MMYAFNNFFMSTGLKVNPGKCRIYFGGVEDSTKEGHYKPHYF